MRVSELVARTGVPLATVKYYLREGLLMPGEATSATQARYGEKHVERLGLVKALAGAGLPIPRIREILRLVDHPHGSLFEVLGEAIAQLPPYLDASDDDTDEFPRARAVLDRLGQVYDPRYVAVGQLERALEGLEEAGIPMTEERLEAYGRHVRGIAEIDIGLMPTEPAEDAIRYAVLGTAIYEPVIAAMRRLAHQDVAQKRLRNPEEQDQQ
ncbi:MerR family transcriptional regulator [Rhodococcus opacus]|uniref:MerR family transcriptional regulator n=1 Tax=Rhodococcus TaxID=1827 RepID=UPI001063E941|nr:MerR family transcriptional regulator [Rhodococcus opacus]MDV6240095.1 MerR family transcriptional regulator [Rhodococcus opacus]NHU42935.1 MerR family transcriptional regulator [Rhodococcus sp. A14]